MKLDKVRHYMTMSLKRKPDVIQDNSGAIKRDEYVALP